MVNNNKQTQIAIFYKYNFTRDNIFINIVTLKNKDYLQIQNNYIQEVTAYLTNKQDVK